MRTAAIREKLVKYMQMADDKKVKAIYTIVEDEIITYENEWDDDFIKELKRRTNAFIKGTSKGHSWEETKKAAIDRVSQPGNNDLSINNEAHEEYIQAYNWYELMQIGLGKRFMDCVDLKLQQICDHPEYYGKKQNHRFRVAKVEPFLF